MSTVSNMASTSRQGDALGRYMTFMSLGMFVGPIITGSLINYINYRQLFLVTSLFPAVGLGLFLIYKPKEIRTYNIENESSEKNQGIFSTLKTVLRDRNVLILTFIRSIYSMTNTVFTSLFAVFAVQNLGFTPALAAILFSAVGFSNAFIKFPAGKLADKLGPRKVLFTTFSTLIIVFFLISYIRGVIPILLLLILFGACWGTRAVTEWSTLTNSVSNENKTIAISYLGSIWGVGATLGSLMLGAVGEILTFSTIFMMLGLINIPTLFAINFLKKPNQN
jgi:predicted MFS family arabinose efflux permease